MPTYVQCSYFIFEVKKNPNAFTFIFYTTCPVLFLLQSVKASIPLSDDVYAHSMENNATGMSQSVCGNCVPVLLIYEKRCTSCCECKTSISCFFMFSKCIKRLLEVTQVSHHTFSAWVNATLLSHETVYTIKL